MTTPELYRALADETEKRERLEKEVAALQQELQALRISTIKEQPKELLTVLEASRYLNRSKSFLDKDRHFRLFTIPFVKMGPKSIRYNRSDLDLYIESQRRGKKAA